MPTDEEREAFFARMKAEEYRPPKGYKLYVNDSRTVMVRIWDSGEAEVAIRDTPQDIWGPPIIVAEEK